MPDEEMVEHREIFKGIFFVGVPLPWLVLSTRPEVRYWPSSSHGSSTALFIFGIMLAIAVGSA